MVVLVEMTVVTHVTMVVGVNIVVVSVVVSTPCAWLVARAVRRNGKRRASPASSTRSATFQPAILMAMINLSRNGYGR